MVWERLRGHSEHKEGFRRAAGRGRLGHAYLLVGPEGVGKSLFARLLAQCLMCERTLESDLEACGDCPACKQLRAETHSDFYAIGCPTGKNVLPIELFAGPKEHRGKQGLCYELSLSPMEGRRKIAVIDDADRMNLESANALLKTLEEPAANAMLFLIAASSDNVPSTIRSRCQIVRFRPLPTEDVAELLVAEGHVSDPAEARTIAALANGSVASAMQLLDPEIVSLRDLVWKALAAADADRFAISGTVIERVGELAADSAEQRRYAEFVIRCCLEFYRHIVFELSGAASTGAAGVNIPVPGQFAAGTPEMMEQVLELCERGTVSVRQVEQNVSVPLCLEVLFDDLGRLGRAMSSP